MQHPLHDIPLIGELVMRNLILIAALAALTATPASANTRHEMHQVPASLAAPMASNSDLAIRGGQIMGQDPDANVRFALRRDNPTY
jgi:hypothetical protein